MSLDKNLFRKKELIETVKRFEEKFFYDTMKCPCKNLKEEYFVWDIHHYYVCKYKRSFKKISLPNK